jgi:acyl-CoA dehydrogenase
MNEELAIILETASKIFNKHVNHDLRQFIDKENINLINLWNDIEEQGLSRIIVKEKFNGSGLPFSFILPLIKMSNNFGTPLPFSETILSNYLLSESDINPPNGIVTFATDGVDINITNNKISGNLRSIPFLNLTDKIILITEIKNIKNIILLHNTSEKLEPKKNFLADPRFDLQIKNCEIIDIKPLNSKIDFNHLGALMRSAQMIGSMEKALDLSIDYCSQRKQFGRTLSKFQAIQHQISEMAVELSASSAALSAVGNIDEANKNIQDIAILKIRAGIAAGKIIAISHQVHGAIGFTQEYELAYFTRNLNSWRNDFGNENFWETFLGKKFLENSNQNLWEYLTY